MGKRALIAKTNLEKNHKQISIHPDFTSMFMLRLQIVNPLRLDREPNLKKKVSINTFKVYSLLTFHSYPEASELFNFLLSDLMIFKKNSIGFVF